MLDAKWSTFLKQAEKELTPRCVHYETATDLEGTQRRLEAGSSFDLVLLDFELILVGNGYPKPMDPQCPPRWKDRFDEKGQLKLLTEIREAWSKTRTVLMLDYALEASTPDPIKLGAHGAINKNWNWNTILERLAGIWSAAG
jgi:ActR/RegA family two-component response regulator